MFMSVLTPLTDASGVFTEFFFFFVMRVITFMPYYSFI